MRRRIELATNGLIESHNSVTHWMQRSSKPLTGEWNAKGAATNDEPGDQAFHPKDVGHGLTSSEVATAAQQVQMADRELTR